MILEPSVEASRMFSIDTAWARRLRHFDVLCDAGIPAHRALEIVEQSEADRLPTPSPLKTAA
jgi:hypothetical protein